MNYTLVVNPDRAQYLMEKLGDNIIVSEQEESGMTKIIITITSSIDILNIFHAGISCGLDGK